MDSDENRASEKSDCAYQQAIDTLEEKQQTTNNIKPQPYNTTNGRKSKHISQSR
jgi:hypothetical protein